MGPTFTLAALSFLASSALAAPAPVDSWGKAGISLAQYRQDSVECGEQGYYLDISNTDDAKQFVQAQRQLDSLPMGANAGDQAAQFASTQSHIIDSVRPDERFKNIKQMQISKTEQCLESRGYSKFRLTDEQRDRLRKLKFGSDERRAYLYGLASNPAVLQNQRPTAQP